MDQEDDLFEMYDEFGNFIGDAEEPRHAANGHIDNEFEDIEANEADIIREEEQNLIQEDQIILYEDKKYYPEMSEIYKGVETLIEEEDAQAITDPLIRHRKEKKFDLRIPTPETVYEPQFLIDLMTNPHTTRNVAIIGHLHHGKTMLLDTLMSQTHNTEIPPRFTDSRFDEQERLISIKAKPISIVMPSWQDKSYLLNLMDTPGHPNFNDEVCAGVRMSDGVVLVVDCIEGCMLNTEQLIKYVVHEQLPLTLIISKVDRLVVELKIPPMDAYLKLKHTIEEVNNLIKEATSHLPFAEKKQYHLSPLKGNVIFSSNDGGFMFSLLSMARQYCQVWTNMMPDTLMKVLWGDYYFDKESRRFRREPTAGSTKRAFVEFILEPMYKLIVHSISNEKDKLQPILSKLGVYLKNEDFRLSTRQLMKKACRLFFGTSTCFTDMVVEHLPSPAAAASEHVSKYYQGDRTTQVFKNMSSLSKDGPPVVQILKMYNKPDCLTFDCLGRVMSGTLKRGTRVKILGEKYSLEDEEDMTVKNITGLYIFNSRFTIPIKEAHPGNWVLLEGIDQSILKTATVIAEDYDSEKLEIFRPIKFDAEPFFKLAIEPLIPSDLPKMLDGLRKVAKSYPNLKTKIEESGEHMIIGSGELYMDSVMHDLRLMYSEVEIKISDPSVTFCETVIDTSSINCTSKTPNNANKLTFIAEALDKGLGVDIELEHIDLSWPKAQVSNFFSKKYKYDILAAQSVWAFGPDTFGPNLFIDDTLPGETDKDALYEIKESLIQGFQWACREGPLCEEPMRNVKFKIIEAEVAREPLFKIPGQIIPTARRTCYSSFLMANPKILEPQILTEIQCAGDSLPAVYNVLNRRRGHLIKEQAKPGSPLFSVRASLPALDSFGFETDLRSHTVGQAFCLQVFDTWTVLPGDPLDKTIKLTILEPSAPSALAREVLVKTRKRKGLNEEVSILNYFDDPAIIETLRTNDDWKKII